MIKIKQDGQIAYLMQDQVIAISHNTKRNEAKVRFVNGEEVTYFDVEGIDMN